ncbi:rCG25829 [Rattus norvegicus]|uniref:RCG25829 n=1 Tax=Rattus norvegicus TaxID=10116 RepID=A6I258_RAT|nr:rCG25829 [Rattus norvegicus]
MVVIHESTLEYCRVL